MHRALSIADVVRSIIDAIPADNRKSLYGLALTCRSFSDLALDRLWGHHPTSLYFIAMVMPEELRDVSKRVLGISQDTDTEVTDYVWSIKMSSNYSGNDLSWLTERFKAYSNRITAFYIGNGLRPERLGTDHHHHIDRSVYSAWSFAPGGLAALFPKVQSLSCTLKEDADFYLSLASPFLSFGLHIVDAELVAHSTEQAQAASKFLELLAPYSSRLHHLVLYYFSMRASIKPSDETVDKLILHTTTELQHMQTNIALSLEAISHLTHLTSLKIFRNDSVNIKPDVWLNMNRDPFFPGLEYISLCTPLDLTTSIIRAIASRTIRALYFRILGALSVDDLASYLDVCRKHKSTLEQISITPASPLNLMLQHQHVESVIDALKSLPRIERLRLFRFKFPILDPELASRFSHAWPPSFRSLEAGCLSPVSWPLLSHTLATRQWTNIPFGILFDPSPPSPDTLDLDLRQRSTIKLFAAGDPGKNESLKEWASVLRALFPLLTCVVIHPQELDRIHQRRISEVATLLSIECRIE